MLKLCRCGLNRNHQKAPEIGKIGADACCWSLQKRGPVTVKEFIKHYKLEDPTDTDLLLYVTSLCAASKRGAADQRLEQELVHKYEASL